MALRPTQASTFDQVLRGINQNTQRLIRAQEQTATGRRILRPSDDPVGAATSISLRQQISSLASYQASVDDGQPIVETAATEVEAASGLLTEARALLLQGLNGSLSQEDRESIADQVEEVAQALLEVSNARFGDRFLFSGTENGSNPFVVIGEGPDRFVEYTGNEEEQTIRIGRDVGLEINLAGSELFTGPGYSATHLAGNTGLSNGATVDQGTGFSRIQVRTDSVTGLANGLALAATGGTTILGDHQLTLNATDSTIQLGDGPILTIPNPLPTDFSVTNAEGGAVALDLSAWDGTDATLTLTGEGSLSTDGTVYVPVDRTETDLELVIEDVGVVHLDATGLSQAGEELITFRGATNVFDALLGAADDLRQGTVEGLGVARERLEIRFDEIVEHQDQILVGLGRLGARSRRLNDTQDRLDEFSVQLQSRLSNNEDVDLAEVALELNRTEQTLQVALASGARLLQQTLLNFL